MQAITEALFPCDISTAGPLAIVVETEEAVRLALMHQLQRQGFTVRQAENRESALTLCLQHQETPILLMESLRAEWLVKRRFQTVGV